MIANGLPAGSKGEGPQPQDGVVRVEIAKRLLRVLCYQFELRVALPASFCAVAARWPVSKSDMGSAADRNSPRGWTSKPD